MSSVVSVNKYLTVPEVAAHFGVSQALVYREVAAQRIPAIRIGAAIRIPREFVNIKLATPVELTLASPAGRTTEVTKMR